MKLFRERLSRLLFSKSGIHGKNTTPSSLDCFPPEIIFRVALHLPRFKNSHSNSLKNFALTSKAIYELLKPLLFDALYVDENVEYRDFKRAMKSSPSFVNCLHANTRIFVGKLQYYKDKDEMIRLPTLSKLTDVRLEFLLPRAERNGCVVRHPYPRNFRLPISAINTLVGSFDELTSVHLEGLLHSEVVIEGLAKLFELAKNLRSIDIAFDYLSRDDVNLESTYKLMSERLGSLRQLQKFAMSDSCLWYRNQTRHLSDIVVGLGSVPTLTYFSLKASFPDLDADLIPFLSNSNISRLRLDSINITPELSDTIRRMKALTHLSLSSLNCSKYLLSPPRDFDPTIKNYELKYVSFNDDGPSTEIVGLSNAESFEEVSVSYTNALYKSLSTSFKLRDLRCCIRDEECFELVIDVIQKVDSLRSLVVFPREERAEYFSVYYDLLYEAIRSSSIRVFGLNPRMILDTRFDSLLGSETLLEELTTVDLRTIQNEIDFPMLCQSIAGNSTSRFKSLTVKIELQSKRELVKMLEVFRDHRTFRIKLISQSEDIFSKSLKNWFLKVLLSVIESWQKSSSSLVDRVVLDELSDGNYQFFTKNLRRSSKLRRVEFDCVDGEFCMYKKSNVQNK
ncbi:hypothetical protein HK098_000046 [Nowakowskiella sp. JEL0407]|nr:hypothetical protein HK098_000046 [Nowakowskiella sp. JEL0407]